MIIQVRRYGINMDPRERFCDALAMDDTDQVATFLFDLSLGLDVLDIPSTEVFTPHGYDGRKGAKAIAALQKMLGHDAAAGCYRNIEYSVFGAEMNVPEYGIPAQTRPPFRDIDRLYVMEPNMICGTFDEMVLSHNLLREMTDIGIIMNTITPFSAAAVMRGMEAFMMDTASEDGITRDLISFGTEIFKILVEEMGNAEKDSMQVVAPYDNADMLGPDILDRYALDTIRTAIDIGHREGLPVTLHPHGPYGSEAGKRSLRKILDAGPDCIYYGEENDPLNIMDIAEGRCQVMGGIDTFTTIYMGPDGRVRDDVLSILEKTDGKMIFTCSCSVHRGLSLERMEVMMQTVREFSV